MPSPLDVVIADGPVPVCPGIRLAATPLTSLHGDEHASTQLPIEVDGDVGGARLELLGSYENTRHSGPLPTLGIRSWRVRSTPAGVAHEMDVNWPGTEDFLDAPPWLELQLSGGACPYASVIACDEAGCEVRPGER